MEKPALEVRIIRSKKRKKTVQAREVAGVLEVRAPANMSDEALQPIIEKFKKQIARRKKRSVLDDKGLAAKARALNRQYFGGRLKWESIRWVTNQNKRFGSCTPARGTIRISDRVAGMPGFVLDYVLVHELAHLLEPNHGKGFWDLVYQYPLTERARGYLMAVGLEDLDEAG